MPTAREPLLDAVVQAAQGAVVEREFSVAGFARLRDRLAEPTGVARVRLALRLVDAMPVGELALTGAVTLVCQRCLQPMRQELRSESELAFVTEDSDRVPAGHEAITGDPKRVDLAGLVEDELLLALPVVPRHALGETCRLPAGAAAAEEPAAPEMRRPFAGLKDLLKHWFGERSSMAVQKSRKTPSKRGMHRSHDRIAKPALSKDPTTGETHLRHRVSRDGFYRGRKVIDVPVEDAGQE